MRCEKQHWPDCGGPSNTFLPPHAVQGGKANLFLLGFRPKLRQQPTSNNLFSFMMLVGSESQRNWGEAVSGRVAVAARSQRGGLGQAHASKVRDQAEAVGPGGGQGARARGGARLGH